MANTKIREAAKAHGVMLWQLAEALGIQDSGLSKRLRHELPEADQMQIIKVIKDIATKEEG